MWPPSANTPTVENVTRARFEQEIVPQGRPVVLKGLIADWLLVQAARRSDETLVDHLARSRADASVQAWFGAPAIEGRFGYTPDLRGFNHEQRILALGDLLTYMLQARHDPAAFTAYAGAVPIPRTLPELQPELVMPLLDPSRERLVSMWLGGRSRTSAHWDVPQNIACVVAGRRRFMLLPIDQLGNIYLGPLDFTLAGQPTSLVDFVQPDLSAHPCFRNAMDQMSVAELEPGDAIYIPSMWIHHVESLHPFGAMINFWFRDGPTDLVTPLFTLLHALTTLRDLPEHERASWRAVFDHYIFAGPEAAARHLPDQARGILGARSEAMLRRINGIVAEQVTS